MTATVNLDALRHNARVLQDRAGDADLMAVVKANAYGHGAVPVAQALRNEGIRHFAVARVSEAVQLREAGFNERILVLGAPFEADLSAYARYDLDVTVSSATVAKAARRQGRPTRPLRVHVKIETGMGRLGLSPEEAPTVIDRLADAPEVQLAGLWTHFATADEPDSAFPRTQLSRFRSVLDEIDATPETIHVANTGALITMDARTPDGAASLVRTGIALYGIAPTAELRTRIDLRPVMSFTARITHVKTVSAGTPVSYGSHWRAPRPARLATLGVGYGDGYPRLGSGRAVVRIHGEEFPVVGSICMDMCMVDLGPPDQPPAPDVEVGDEAVLFDADGPTVYNVAEWAETIPYEICCGIAPRVPRRYVDASSGHVPFTEMTSPSSQDYSIF